MGTSSSEAPRQYWLAELERHGYSPYHPDKTSYQIFRNVRDYGAVGDGITDDSDAINKAIADGSRCGEGRPDADSSTVSPAVVYLPSGIYRITRPLLCYYYTSLVGDALERPTVLADVSFEGLALLDENPYIPAGHGRTWYRNTNNFFRSIAFLQLDMTRIAHGKECAGIHHQVAQATGLRHLHFEMPRWSASKPTLCKGLFIENGSGGHMTTLTFCGGAIGIWAGNQQFTVSNVHFEHCQRAISQHWCWTWVYHQIRIENCQVGLEMQVANVDRQGEKAQAAASIVCLDWQVRHTHTAFDIVSTQRASARGSLVLSNVRVEGVNCIALRSFRPWDGLCGSGNSEEFTVTTYGDSQVLIVALWTWSGDEKSFRMDDTDRPALDNQVLPRPQAMLDVSGQWLMKLRPEYLDCSAGDFVNVKAWGALGDGQNDDTAALQSVLDAYKDHPKAIMYIPHGQYLLCRTLVVPPNARICGEVWPVLCGVGPFFQDLDCPKPVVQVGEYSGQEGTAEISECILSTRGPCPGAIVLQWNIRAPKGMEPATATPGLWDTHIRLGGFAGSNLDDARFDRERPLDRDNAWACFLGWHVTPGASGCFVNNWVWVADHTLDSSPVLPLHEREQRVAGQQISLLAGRGILIESDPGPVWFWGGASEHFLLYQYQIHKAQNVFIGHAQTESPYFLGEGVALPTELARPLGSPWNDPAWQGMAFPRDAFNVRSYGIRIVQSSSIHLYGPGLYSFFDAYRQEKLPERRCQRALLSIEGCSGNEMVKRSGVTIVNLNTVGVQSMADCDGQTVIREQGRLNGFTNTLTRLNIM